MNVFTRSRTTFLIAGILYIIASFTVLDTYNTLNHRTFPELMLQGNPFTLAKDTFLEARGTHWKLDWPYPPFTLVVLYPAWVGYHLTGSELVYQAYCMTST